ncbi:hypothetical protein DY000_02003761 [Brassica cretica]|uniref:Callose synthase helical domain-containing protein n=1 Tax=Brassica cretica TaxID=69181 RepID=A0ABQ7CBJ1_BRACR|nr:hypothetical protein DY000_02003761 [Brassica cretica]
MHPNWPNSLRTRDEEGSGFDEETVRREDEEETVVHRNEQEAMDSGENSSVEADDCEVIVEDMAGYKEESLQTVEKEHLKAHHKSLLLNHYKEHRKKYHTKHHKGVSDKIFGSNSQTIPGAFMRALHVPLTNRTSDPSYQAVDRKNIVDAAHFAPFWNQIIKCLREEDYITEFEMELLMMPKNSDNQLERYLPIGSVATFSSFQQGAFVTLPACVLRLNILLAKEIAAESNSQDEIVEGIARDDYMKYAVKEVYHTLKLVLTETLEAEGRMWVERIYEDIDTSIKNRKIHHNFQLNKLSLVITRVTALLGILVLECAMK